LADLFLGWDVGAWNCDRNRKSRDALCALEIRESGPVLLGKAWRGNLRDLLVALEGSALVDALLERLHIAAEEKRHLTIAIDTPLAWPRTMIELVAGGAVVDVPGEADRNPYIFRAQEVALFGRKHRPLSVVRDMIGSQSTKGIHFLRQGRLVPSAIGVWSREATVAIETYPSAAIRDEEVARLTAQLLADLLGREDQPRDRPWADDVRDAITCALVAWLHRQRSGRLEAPHEAADGTEGWIWLPAAVLAST
jgi:hypothetical protein